MGNINLLAIFLTGLTTGGLTCMAVQGGLLATTIAQREENRLKSEAQSSGHAFPILAFLVAKLVAYTILGFLLGWFGSLFQLSLTATVIMQLFVILFMAGTALNILNVHPIFRYFVIQPPKFFTRMVRNQSKSKDFFAPAILGAFTIFIPCGTTQAMMALAIGSGKPILGALILFAFVLGTSPVFFLLGYFATRLGEVFQQKFMRIAAFGILLLAAFNFNNTVALTGFDLNPVGALRSFYCTISFCSDSPALAYGGSGVLGNAINRATITIGQNGYTPGTLTVKAGSQVKLQLVNQGGVGCIQAFTIPKLGIRKIVPVGSSETVQFTAPAEPGQLAFMCSMGMYRGVINVI